MTLSFKESKKLKRNSQNNTKNNKHRKKSPWVKNLKTGSKPHHKKKNQLKSRQRSTNQDHSPFSMNWTKTNWTRTTKCGTTRTKKTSSVQWVPTTWTKWYTIKTSTTKPKSHTSQWTSSWNSQRSEKSLKAIKKPRNQSAANNHNDLCWWFILENNSLFIYVRQEILRDLNEIRDYRHWKIEWIFEMISFIDTNKQKMIIVQSS